MTRIEKRIVVLGVSISALLGTAILAFVGFEGVKPSKTASPVVSMSNRTALHWEETGVNSKATIQSTAKTSATTATTMEVSPLPPNATCIPDENLQQLSILVDLAGARENQPDKKRWSKAVPIAEKLMEAPHDCSQRIWLKHFIEMGNYALSDSSEEYRKTARLMATLARSDAQSMAISSKPDKIP